MAGEHVFISYITEDSDAVDELQEALEAADFIVWRDKDKLWPGDDWEAKIREAIRGGSFVFLACFSSNLAKRQKSYQFEELTVAAEEYRQRPPGAPWLMTARLDECEIPDFDLGAGRTLARTIHRADLFGKKKSAQLTRLVLSVQRAMGNAPSDAPPAVTRAAEEADRASSDVVERVRALLRNPSLVMDYDDYMGELRSPILAELADRDAFPMSIPRGVAADVDFVRGWVGRVRRYDEMLADTLVPLKLITMYGARVHEKELTRTLQAFANESTQTAGTEVLTSVHEYPAVLLTFAGALGAMAKDNFSMFRAVTADVIVQPMGLPRVPFILTSGSQSVTNLSTWQPLGTVLCLEDEEKVVTDEQIQMLLTKRGATRYTSISDHLFAVLSPLYRDQFGGDADYARAFDRLEVLLDAVSEDARSQAESYYGKHGGYGRYTWRHRYGQTPPETEALAEAKEQGAGWTPLLAGLFGGRTERAVAALEAVETIAKGIRDRRF